MPGVSVCNPFVQMYRSSVYVNMPAVQLYKLSCCIYKVYIYIFRVYSCVYVLVLSLLWITVLECGGVNHILNVIQSSQSTCLSWST